MAYDSMVDLFYRQDAQRASGLQFMNGSAYTTESSETSETIP